MRYLSAQDLLDLVAPASLIAAIEQGLRDFAAHETVVPVRQHIDFGDNTLLAMPVIGKSVFGAKIVSVTPANAGRGQPVINGLMTLSDGLTGAPLAVLNAAMLTAQRTGAVGALGLKYTTPPEIDRIGLIGIGVQGTWQAIFACAVRPVRTLHFVARSDEKAQHFIHAVSRHAPAVRFIRCADAREVVSQSQAVIAATTSSTPVLPGDPALLENKHFVSVGSFKPSMMELPLCVHELARQVVIDSDAAKHEAGDLIEPLASGLLSEAGIIHIADLVTGARLVNVGRTTVFKSVGMALYDLCAAQAFHAEAVKSGRGTPLEA